MKAGQPGKILRWSGVAVAACLVLAMRDAAVMHFGEQADAVFWMRTAGQRAAWSAVYYVMWAALTPFIFALARRVRFRRGHRSKPFAFHLATSLVVATIAPVVVGVTCGAVAFGIPLPATSDLLTSCWRQVVTYRAVADITHYWMILTAGLVLQAYDEDRARRTQAEDLERALVSAQVDALKMKLHPHFLFNTLNAINVLAVEKDTRAVVATAERLADLLRSSIESNGRQFAPVAEELAWLDQYLAIEETRFGDRLRVVRRIEPAARRALVPSLILQPIIENAIKHGFSRRIDASCLTITICRDGDALVASVEDDGPGLPHGWDLTAHCGRGLRNVIERLEWLYAGASAFTLTGASTRGTVATLRLPWRDAA